MSGSCSVIVVDRPAEGPALGQAARRHLSSGLRDARRSGATAVVVEVVNGAWAWEWDGEALSAKEVSREMHAGLLEILALDVPVVARLSGLVSGYGLALALACDLRFGDESTRLSVGRVGSPDPLLSGLPSLLRERLGVARAQDWLLTGRELDVTTARDLGVISAADPDNSVAALTAAPGPVTSALVRAISGRSLAELKDDLAYEAWLGALAARAAHE